MKNVVGIVLAGGQSRRFGSPKAFALYKGKPFYEFAVAALAPHCDEVVVVTRPELTSRIPTSYNVITDVETYKGQGPLAGILSGMKELPAERYIVLPCDMPHVDAEVIGSLVKAHENLATAVTSEGRNHPLVSVWSENLQPQLIKSLENNQLSVLKFLSKVDVCWIEGSSLTGNENRVFMNMNTPESLERR